MTTYPTNPNAAIELLKIELGEALHAVHHVKHDGSLAYHAGRLSATAFAAYAVGAITQDAYRAYTEAAQTALVESRSAVC
jgi:hypothetical protein